MENNSLYHWGVKGMKWGVRRYQNKDGTLTDAGKKRYERDIKDNLAKKKDKRIDTSKPDPNRWEKEDLERTKKTVDATSNLVNQVQKLDSDLRKTQAKNNMDLSNMTDQELRQRINRELTERQYRELFSQESASTVSKGREYLTTTLNVAGTALGVAGSALSIALAIKELRG